MELSIEDLVPYNYYQIKPEDDNKIHIQKFIKIEYENFALFDSGNGGYCAKNPKCHKFYSNIKDNIKILIIEPNQFDPITLDDIDDGDRIILINNDKRFMFKENTFNNMHKNPYTGEYVNKNNIIKYIVVVLPNYLLL
jgi:hypothetical protein